MNKSNLSQKFDMIRCLVIFFLKKKAQGSYINLIWDMFFPIISFILMSFFFTNNLGKDILYYNLYVFIGLIHSAYLFLAVAESMQNVIENANLIKSLNFNKGIMIFSSVLSSYFIFLFSWIIFSILLFYYGLNPIYMVFLPLIIIIEILIISGICYIFSILVAYIRELPRIWGMMMSIAWLTMPVIYKFSDKTLLIYKINLLNPVFHIMTFSRDILLYNNIPSLLKIIVLFLFSIVVLITGLSIFLSNKKYIEML